MIAVGAETKQMNDWELKCFRAGHRKEEKEEVTSIQILTC